MKDGCTAPNSPDTELMVTAGRAADGNGEMAGITKIGDLEVGGAHIARIAGNDAARAAS